MIIGRVNKLARKKVKAFPIDSFILIVSSIYFKFSGLFELKRLLEGNIIF